jgi:hypothetical protein
MLTAKTFINNIEDLNKEAFLKNLNLLNNDIFNNFFVAILELTFDKEKFEFIKKIIKYSKKNNINFPKNSVFLNMTILSTEYSQSGIILEELIKHKMLNLTINNNEAIRYVVYDKRKDFFDLLLKQKEINIFTNNFYTFNSSFKSKDTYIFEELIKDKRTTMEIVYKSNILNTIAKNAKLEHLKLIIKHHKNIDLSRNNNSLLKNAVETWQPAKEMIFFLLKRKEVINSLKKNNIYLYKKLINNEDCYDIIKRQEKIINF